jgi:hypothetical protein
VGAVGEKTPQAVVGLRDGIGLRDADEVEAVRLRRLGQRALERRRIGQKSRSA